MKFSGICLITHNVPVLVDFYSLIMGVQVEGDDNHAELKVDGAGLAIFSV
jgi:hypothetical protein